jgi:hypothetical protein
MRVGGCTPTPFQPITITYKVAMHAPAQRSDTLSVFHLYPICTLCSPLWVSTATAETSGLGLGFVYIISLFTFESSMHCSFS